MTRSVRYGLGALLALIILFVLGVAGLRIWAGFRQRQADLAWAASFESNEAFLARYPTVPNSPAAVQLASLAQPIGLVFQATSNAEVTVVSKAGVDAIQRFIGGLGQTYDDATPIVMPAEVTALLSDHRTALDAIERHLGSGPIVWAIDIHQGLTAPRPPLLAIRYLGSTLLARALQASLGGDRPSAARSLDAFGALVRSVNDRPELISQLVVMAMTSLQNAVLRQAGDPRAGEGRDPGHDSESDRIAAALRAIRMDVMAVPDALRRSPDTGSGGTVAGTLKRAKHVVNSFFAAFESADYSVRMERLISEMRNTADPCTVDVTDFSNRADARMPVWNPIARSASPGLVRSWASAVGAALDTELTQQVVRARVANEAPGAIGVQSFPSRVCASLSWRVERLANGDVLVTADTGRPIHQAIIRNPSFHLVHKPAPPRGRARD